MQLAFCQRNAEAARRDLVRICAEIREELEPETLPLGQAVALARGGADAPAAAGAQRIAGAVYVSCAGRGGPHFGAPSAELAIVRHALGDVPLVGFFAAGEIGAPPPLRLHRRAHRIRGGLSVRLAEPAPRSPDPKPMRTDHGLAVLALAVLGGGVAVAQERAGAASQIYQQRTADGRIVLSDRPLPGAHMQRTWQFVPEDAAAAQQRRDIARRDAEAVSERIQRQLDREQQRAEELALERLRLAQAQAERAAERARYEAQYEPAGVVYWPRHAHVWPRHPHIGRDTRCRAAPPACRAAVPAAPLPALPAARATGAAHERWSADAGGVAHARLIRCCAVKSA